MIRVAKHENKPPPNPPLQNLNRLSPTILINETHPTTPKSNSLGDSGTDRPQDFDVKGDQRM
ncbi:MAG: hypothetical protein KAU14_08135 [Thermoplasmata archaeon]|nr:hypothetical protein [Thermoplasmata archaeon]